MTITTVEQGSIVRLLPEEMQVMKSLLKERNLSWDYFDEKQCVMKLPQQYVGYIQFRGRRLIIKPKHPGVTISHILRIYFFLYSAEYSDIDTPMYDVEPGNDLNLVTMFIKELLAVVQRGIPVEYTERNDELYFSRGKLNVVRTKTNILQRRSAVFNCDFDDLSRDIPINRVLVSAAKKIEAMDKDSNLAYAIRQFGEIDYDHYPESVMMMRNTAYCKKALSLAYMILRDLTLSATGDDSIGESLLINFDRVFEKFIQKILMEYSGMGNFSYWSVEKQYAFCQNQEGYFERSFIPDLLFEYKETVSGISARAILDMKNKVSKPFENPDIYEMSFYAQMLHTKKVILCYPSSGYKESSILRFTDERYYLQKAYAVHMNLIGNTAKEFKDNIQKFIYGVEEKL